MRSSLLSSVAILPALFAGPAMAAAPPPAESNWTGFYIGLNAGGAWGTSKVNTFADCNNSAGAANFYFCFPGNRTNEPAVNSAGSGTINTSGFIGGVQFGYNWQISNLILGLETDFGSCHLKDSRQASGVFPEATASFGVGTPFTVNSSVATDWLYTLRGRVGTTALMPNLMVYATGGLALTRLTITESYSDAAVPPGAGNFSTKGEKTGWTLGGGLEWALSNAWSVKVEYLHLDFGKITASGAILNPGIAGYGQGISTSADLTADVARIGVNRKF
jgi:outer membrane immunogenic protein